MSADAAGESVLGNLENPDTLHDGRHELSASLAGADRRTTVGLITAADLS